MRQSLSWEGNRLLGWWRNYPSYYGTPRLITVFTTASHLSLSLTDESSLHTAILFQLHTHTHIYIYIYIYISMLYSPYTYVLITANGFRFNSHALRIPFWILPAIPASLSITTIIFDNFIAHKSLVMVVYVFSQFVVLYHSLVVQEEKGGTFWL